MNQNFDQEVRTCYRSFLRERSGTSVTDYGIAYATLIKRLGGLLQKDSLHSGLSWPTLIKEMKLSFEKGERSHHE